MIALEGFRSAGLEASGMVGTLQHNLHQHSRKLGLEEEKCEIASGPTSSSQSTPDDASSADAYHHQ
jgi:hypothetical protein